MSVDNIAYMIHKNPQEYVNHSDRSVRMIAKMLLMMDEWKEELHERGKDGRFVKMSSGEKSVSGNFADGRQRTLRSRINNRTGVREYNGWDGKWDEVQCDGTGETKRFIAQYRDKNPDFDLDEEAKKYKDVLSKVRNFSKDNPDAEDGTYDAITGEKKETSGYCVTFHQNKEIGNEYGDYDDETYAQMVAITMRELGVDSVNIGYFGNPEVSFDCPDKETAMRFAVKQNQHSVFNSNSYKLLMNKAYSKSTNPIDDDLIMKKQEDLRRGERKKN